MVRFSWLLGCCGVMIGACASSSKAPAGGAGGGTGGDPCAQISALYTATKCGSGTQAAIDEDAARCKALAADAKCSAQGTALWTCRVGVPALCDASGIPTADDSKCTAQLAAIDACQNGGGAGGAAGGAAGSAGSGG